MKLLLLLATFSFLLLGFNLKEMSLEEKIGQLFVIPISPSRDVAHQKEVFDLIKKYHIGGVILKLGNMQQYRELIPRLQALDLKIPLLLFADAEWGLGMRIDDALTFPKNLTLGALNDLSLTYRTGQEIGRQCRELGIAWNLAPVVDVNNNPQNPIIHMRSFGDDPKKVGALGCAMMRGMQHEGILTCAKHFPGHGDTETDSHLDMPLIKHGLNRLETCELIPFQKMIEEGVDAIMTAHIKVSSLSEDPVTFSHEIVTNLLKKKMGFQGVVISDALNMKALTEYFSKAEIGLRALMAGHDILLYGDHINPLIDVILREDIPQSISGIKNGVKEGTIAESLIDEHVLKILKIKNSRSTNLKRDLYKKAITLIKDEKKLLPLLKPLEFKKGVKYFLDHTQEHLVIIIYDTPSEEEILKIQSMPKDSLVILFTTPYLLPKFKDFSTIVMAYENDPIAHEVMNDLLLGLIPFQGRLPITTCVN